MLFYPQSIREAGGKLVLPENTNAVAHPCLGAAVIGEFWQNFFPIVSMDKLPQIELVKFLGGFAVRGIRFHGGKCRKAFLGGI